MSATFTRRAKYLTFAGLATLGLAALAQVAVTPIASSADSYSVPLHNTDTEDTSGCPESPSQNGTGWHFVLPSDAAVFVSVSVTFTNAGVITAPSANGTIDGKHAWLYTPTDDTIESGTAVVSGGSIDKFVFSHHCAGVEESPSATPSTTPSTTPSETPSETPTVAPTTVPPTTEAPSESPTTVPPTTEAPSETPSETPTVAPTTVAPTTEAPSESPSETPSAEVSGTKIESPSQTPSETVSESPTASPTVLGERETRGPAALPTTGSPIPVGLLLILGFGLVGAGVVATVAGEPHATTVGGKHRA